MSGIDAPVCGLLKASMILFVIAAGVAAVGGLVMPLFLWPYLRDRRLTSTTCWRMLTLQSLS